MRKILLFLLLIFNAILFSSCGQKTETSAAELPNLSAIQTTNISFSVTLKNPLEENHSMAIQFANALTGEYTLENTILMENVDELHNRLILSLSTHTILQYRYVQIDTKNKLIIETDVNGFEINSRFYFPIHSALIIDHVYNWTKNPLEMVSGRIHGVLTAEDGITPIEGAIVSGGGQNTVSAVDGSFNLNALLTGKHTITIFLPDFEYQPFAQEAVVAENMATPVNISLKESKMVLVNFHVQTSEDTPLNIPISISGSIPSLGKTYCILENPCANLPEKTPDLTPNGDGTFSYSAYIPMGFNLTYHYTIGNEHFNIEHTAKGLPVYRSMQVSEEGSIEVVYDEIASWSDGNYKELWFDVQLPAHTPKNEIISIQIRERGAELWTAPIPIWKISDDLWGYRISSVADIEEIEYRYCRNSLCGKYSGLATDQDSPLKKIAFSKKNKQSKLDEINWLWLHEEMHNDYDLSQLSYQPNQNKMLKGIGISPAYTSALEQYLYSNIGEVSKMNGDTLVFSPTWTVTHNTPPTMNEMAGSDMPVETLENLIKIAKNAGYTVILYPQLNYVQETSYWWFSAPINDAWWTVWFEQYEQFVSHFATIAQRNGIDIFVLGADNILPALPQQTLPNGNEINHPKNIAQIWKDVLKHTRINFDGEVFWATNSTAIQTMPTTLKNNADGVYLLWADKLAKNDSANLDILTEHAVQNLSLALQNIVDYSNLDVLIAIGYPSANGAANACVIAADDSCLDGFEISPIMPFLVSSASNFEIQNTLYIAMFQAINQFEMIDGIITSNFFNAVRMQEKSASVNGKPAEETVSYWFSLINH